jgi:site-specific recombinase XerD
LVRKTVFKKAFECNNLKYLKPHSFRHSMARAMKKISNGVELSIALAENYGHKSGM